MPSHEKGPRTGIAAQPDCASVSGSSLLDSLQMREEMSRKRPIRLIILGSLPRDCLQLRPRRLGPVCFCNCSRSSDESTQRGRELYQAFAAAASADLRYVTVA
jgi:hypothetical protein